MKRQALNADKVLIESVTAKLTMESKLVNKKTLQVLDSFYNNSTKVIDNIQYNPSQNHCINLCDISSSILSENSPSFENILERPIHGTSMTNSEVPENQINIHLTNLLLKKMVNIQISTNLNVNQKLLCYTFLKKTAKP